MKLTATAAFKVLLETALSNQARIDLVLRSGQKFAGKVTEVGDDIVILNEQPGRELFDIAILIAEIAAIETRAR